MQNNLFHMREYDTVLFILLYSILITLYYTETFYELIIVIWNTSCAGG